MRFCISSWQVFTRYNTTDIQPGQPFELKEVFFIDQFEEVIENEFGERKCLFQNFNFSDTEEDEDPAFAIEVVTHNFSLVLLARTEEEKKEWLEAIQAAVSMYKNC